MTRDPFDETLTRALRDPSTGASPGFTAEVVARIGERPAPTLWSSRPALAAMAAVALLAVGIVLGLAVGGLDRPAAEEVVEREQLLREFEALQLELQQLRRLADESRPVLYLGGDESIDLLYDLRGYEDRLEAGDYRPASLPGDRG